MVQRDSREPRGPDLPVSVLARLRRPKLELARGVQRDAPTVLASGMGRDLAGERGVVLALDRDARGYGHGAGGIRRAETHDEQHAHHRESRRGDPGA